MPEAAPAEPASLLDIQWAEWSRQAWEAFSEAVASPIFIAQAALIGASLVLAWWVARRCEEWFNRLLAPDRSVPRRISHEGLVRVTPLAAALVVAGVARGILAQLDLATRLIDIAIGLIFALLIIRAAVFILRVAMGPQWKLRAWENTIGIVVWTAVALQLVGWLQPTIAALDRFGIKIGEPPDQKVYSLWWAIKLAAIVGLFIAVSFWIARVVERRVMRSTTFSPSMRVGISKFTNAILIALAILIGLNAAGINLATLTVFAGAVGLGLGFGLQRVASNFISGFVLIMDRSIRPGDVISIEGESFGWVQELRGRYVVVRDRDGVDTLIPNENMITSRVINWSYSDRKVRLKIPVEISYGDDPELALELLAKAADGVPRVLDDPKPAPRLMGFGDSGIELELRIWIGDPEEGVNNVRSDVNRSIWRHFKAAGITIPYPQRDLHLRSVEGAAEQALYGTRRAAANPQTPAD